MQTETRTDNTLKTGLDELASLAGHLSRNVEVADSINSYSKAEMIRQTLEVAYVHLQNKGNLEATQDALTCIAEALLQDNTSRNPTPVDQESNGGCSPAEPWALDAAKIPMLDVETLSRRYRFDAKTLIADSQVEANRLLSLDYEAKQRLYQAWYETDRHQSIYGQEYEKLTYDQAETKDSQELLDQLDPVLNIRHQRRRLLEIALVIDVLYFDVGFASAKTKDVQRLVEDRQGSTEELGFGTFRLSPSTTSKLLKQLTNETNLIDHLSVPQKARNTSWWITNASLYQGIPSIFKGISLRDWIFLNALTFWLPEPPQSIIVQALLANDLMPVRTNIPSQTTLAQWLDLDANTLQTHYAEADRLAKEKGLLLNEQNGSAVSAPVYTFYHRYIRDY